MKKTLILIVAAMLSMGAVAQTKKGKASKKVDPIMQIYLKQQAEFEAANAEVSKKMKELEAAYYAAKTRDEQEAISKSGMEVFGKYDAAQQEYVKNNPSTVYAASIISPRVSMMSLEQAKAAYEKFSEEAKQSHWGQEINKVVTARENILPGKPAPIIAKNDINGKPFSMADLKGKVVILDFWASWCVPCRKSNPHMLRIYEKYHKMGLDFVYVGDNDSRPEDLVKAIEQDGLNKEGIHHLLRGLKTLKDKDGKTTGFDRSEDVSDFYAVHSLPTKFLIGKDGNIIGKVEDDKWLDEQLSQIFLGKPNRDFHIDGKIDGAEGDTLRLIYESADGKYADKTCKIENGKFSFDGTIPTSVAQARISLGNTRFLTRQTKIFSLYLEPGEMEIGIKVDDFKNPTIQGSRTQREHDLFQKTIKEENDKLDEISAKMEGAKGEEYDALRAQMAPYSSKIRKAQNEYAKKNPKSFVSLEFLYYNVSNMSYAEIKEIYEQMTEEQLATQYGKSIKNEVETLAKIQPGCEAYVIKKNDVMTGKPFDMSKLRGKYVILDFWATWCVPCRKSNPHMIELYNKYHKKGVEFVFIADDDNNEAKLREAIKKDGLQKMHHVLRGLKRIPGTREYDKSEDISNNYAVHSIPTKFLIDKEGNVVGKFESEELESKLAEIFSK